MTDAESDGIDRICFLSVFFSAVYSNWYIIRNKCLTKHPCTTNTQHSDNEDVRVEY